jgi:hypothetical protein
MNCDELSVIDCSKERQYDKKIVSKKRSPTRIYLKQIGIA